MSSPDQEMEMIELVWEKLFETRLNDSTQKLRVSSCLCRQ